MEEQFTYLARGKCGCIVGAISAGLDANSVANFCSEQIALGYSIARVLSADFRTGKYGEFGCSCVPSWHMRCV